MSNNIKKSVLADGISTDAACAHQKHGQRISAYLSALGTAHKSFPTEWKKYETEPIRRVHGHALYWIISCSTRERLACYVTKKDTTAVFSRCDEIGNTDRTHILNISDDRQPEWTNAPILGDYNARFAG